MITFRCLYATGLKLFKITWDSLFSNIFMYYPCSSDWWRFNSLFFRISRVQVFCIKNVLENFTKFTLKHLLLTKLQSSWSFIESLRHFFVNFSKFLRTSTLQNPFGWHVLCFVFFFSNFSIKKLSESFSCISESEVANSISKSLGCLNSD